MSDATIRYWAAARDAAGTGEEGCAAGTLGDVLDEARGRHGTRLSTVLDACSFLVDGSPVGRRSHALVTVGHGSTVEVLPPFAGG